MNNSKTFYFLYIAMYILSIQTGVAKLYKLLVDDKNIHSCCMYSTVVHNNLMVVTNFTMQATINC